MADLDRDEALLERMGYRQELLRRLSGFSNFAISFSIICILAGGITSFHQGLSSVGGASIGIGWPLVCLFSLVLAATMGQIASAFPSAGGIYHWAHLLGGRGWGWAAAWLNLIGLVAVLAAIDLGCWLFILRFVGPALGLDTAGWGPGLRFAVSIGGLAVMLASQGLVNHRGIRLTARLIDFSGYWILLVSAALVVLLLVYAPHWEFGRLFRFENFSGARGGNVWPETSNLFALFTLGLLLPAYTLTGYDASAHAAEETVNASEVVPKGIVRSVAISALAGWVLLSAVVVSLPDVAGAAAQGEQSFFWAVGRTLPPGLAWLLYVGIAVSQYLCGLATVTSASRMAYAFARDGGLPFSSLYRRVSERHRTPVPAIWGVCVSALALSLYAPVYETMAAVSALFLDLSYVIPTALGLVAFGGRWKTMGPWQLGAWFRPFAVVSVLGCAALVVVGTRPPNEKSGIILGVSFVVLTLVWWARERKRFPGPAIDGAAFLSQAPDEVPQAATIPRPAPRTAVRPPSTPG